MYEDFLCEINSEEYSKVATTPKEHATIYDTDRLAVERERKVVCIQMLTILMMDSV